MVKRCFLRSIQFALILKNMNALRDITATLIRWAGRLYPLFRTLAAALVCAALFGCVVGYRGQELGRITPEVGLVITYPVGSGVSVHSGTNAAAHDSPDLAQP